jgi:sec-independent protein translocase protein TatA
MIVVLLLAVLLFGANKIPKLARSTGEAIGEFQQARDSDPSNDDKENA